MPGTITYLAAACAALLSAATFAAPIDADGQWHAFDVDDFSAVSGGLEWIDLDGHALHFSFTTSTPTVLRVVDAGAYSGDQFEIFNHGSSLGLTSVGSAGGSIAPLSNFDAAFADHAHFSYAQLLLQPGSYDLGGVLRVSAVDEFGAPLNATVGAVSLAAVPLPAPGLLLSTTGALLGLTLRRRSVI
jgi:hypothetical protein